MSYSKNVIQLLGILVFLSGCGKQISNFVGSKDKLPLPNSSTPPVASPRSNKAIKLSPGSGVLMGDTISGKMTITPTQQTLKGSTIEARISINQSRTN